MSGVYTTQLAGVQGSDESITIGPWPGYRVVVVDLELAIDAADGSQIFVLDDGSANAIAIATWSDSGNPESAQWRGRCALTDGGTMTVTGTGQFGLIATGYLLSLP